MLFVRRYRIYVPANNAHPEDDYSAKRLVRGFRRLIVS